MMPARSSFSLYIHWPFCLAKCPYCDFNSHVGDIIDPDHWQKALIQELENSAYHLAENLDRPLNQLELSSIFFGGGTPTLMPPKLVAALIDKACDLFSVAENIEITAEANPTSAETAKLKGFKQAGINRLSLGVQSLTLEGLAFLGREHSTGEALDAVEKAAKLFSRWSADLIYGLPHQTLTNWQSQLDHIMGYQPNHLSCYQLTIEEGTVFHTLARKGAQLTAEADQVADLYLLTESVLAEYGLPAYEVSNYAGPEAVSRHNLNYWQAGNWLGIGPGAHSRISTKKGRLQQINRRSPTGWLAAVDAQKTGLDKAYYETAKQSFDEYWMMGLRLAAGREWPKDQLFAKEGLQLNESWLERFIEEGWLVSTPEKLATTLEGRLRLNSILSHLLD